MDGRDSTLGEIYYSTFHSWLLLVLLLVEMDSRLVLSTVPMALVMVCTLFYVVVVLLLLLSFFVFVKDKRWRIYM